MFKQEIGLKSVVRDAFGFLGMRTRFAEFHCFKRQPNSKNSNTASKFDSCYRTRYKINKKKIFIHFFQDFDYLLTTNLYLQLTISFYFFLFANATYSLYKELRIVKVSTNNCNGRLSCNGCTKNYNIISIKIAIIDS